MSTLYRLFMGRILKIGSVGLVGLICIVQILSRLGLSLPSLLTVSSICSTSIALMVGASLLPKNLPWILPLPLSRGKIWATNALISLSLLPLTALGCVILWFVTWSIENGVAETWAEISNRAVGFFHGSWGQGLFRVVFTMFVVNMVVGFCLVIFRSPKIALYMVPRDAKARGLRRLAIGLGGAFLATFFLRRVLENSFAVISCAFICGALVVSFSVSGNLVLDRVRRRWLVIAAAAVGGLEVAYVYAIALLQISTGDPVKISNTILFLGPFSGTVSERDLRSVLERPTDPSTFESLSGRYLAEYANGKPLRNGSLKGPSLDRVIASTTSPEGLSSIGALYNFESFGLPEARDFLSRAVVTRGGDSADWLIYYFVKNSWPEKDTEELLRSQSDLENALGLVRVRYLRGEKWIAVIRGNIGHYNDHRKLQALGTLSGLLGRHLGISDLTAAADEKRSLGTYDAEACDGFAPRSLSDLRSAGEATMNICLRQEALARLSVHELQQVEEGGWYSSPLSSFQKARFRQVYQMKN